MSKGQPFCLSISKYSVFIETVSVYLRQERLLDLQQRQQERLQQESEEQRSGVMIVHSPISKYSVFIETILSQTGETSRPQSATTRVT